VAGERDGWGRLVDVARRKALQETCVGGREGLRAHLAAAGVPTVLNYPKALPFYPAYAYLSHTATDFPVAYRNQSRILSLPLYPEMRVEEYLTFAASLRMTDTDALRQRLGEVVARCGLTEVRHTLIGSLSRGYRQRPSGAPDQLERAQHGRGDPALAASGVVKPRCLACRIAPHVSVYEDLVVEAEDRVVGRRASDPDRALFRGQDGGGVVGGDDVDGLYRWHGGLGGIGTADELLRPVPLHLARISHKSQVHRGSE